MSGVKETVTDLRTQGQVFKAKVSFSKRGKNIEAKSRSIKNGLLIFGLLRLSYTIQKQ